MTRHLRSFVWVHPDDCLPPHGLDMQSRRDADKVEKLRLEFFFRGFDINMPALVGYPLDGKIQLLSGTHRHLAALQANIMLPVTVWLRSDIERMWGTDLWPLVIKDIPVKDLMKYEVKDGFASIPYEPVVLPTASFVPYDALPASTGSFLHDSIQRMKQMDEFGAYKLSATIKVTNPVTHSLEVPRSINLIWLPKIKTALLTPIVMFWAWFKEVMK